MSWGILAPDALISQRRQQNLGLASAVRHFNDRSVPGLGGMWFAMPILWSVLAVSIAEELRVPALPVGNAIAALMAEPIDRLVQRHDTEVGRQRVRDPPRQNHPRMPVHDRNQIEDLAAHR